MLSLVLGVSVSVILQRAFGVSGVVSVVFGLAAYVVALSSLVMLRSSGT